MTTTMIDKRVAARLLRLRGELADTAGHLQTRANTGVDCGCHHGQLCETHARAYSLMMDAEEAKESELYKAGKKLTTVLEVERFADSLEIEMSNTNQHGCLIWLSVEEVKLLAEFLTGWLETVEATGAATEPRYTADQIEAAMIAVDDALDLGDEPVTAQQWRQLVMERLSGNST